MKDYKVNVRIDAETNGYLVEMGRRLDIPKGAVVRPCIQEGLSRYDRHLDFVRHHGGDANQIALSDPHDGRSRSECSRASAERWLAAERAR